MGMYTGSKRVVVSRCIAKDDRSKRVLESMIKSPSRKEPLGIKLSPNK